jgi:methylamine utilization protein MauE
MKKSIVIEIICGLLILLFTYTGLSKLYNHELFHSQLIVFPLIKYAEPLLSWVLPVTELIVALLLFTQKLRLAALYITLVLLIAFTVYLIVMILFDINLPCSCGGIIQYLSWKAHVVFNLFFIAVTVIGIALQKNIKADFFQIPKIQSS